MNINSPNLLTLLAGAQGFNPLLNAEGASAGDFAQALIAEIGQLQNVGAQGQLSVPVQSLDKLSEDSLQDIAALLGNKLPIAAKVDRDINLEETLTALKEVLQHIDAATTSELAPVSEENPLFDQGGKDKQMEEDVDSLLQLLAENQENSAYAVMIPSAIENVKEPTLDQEGGTVQAEAGKNAHDLLQSLVQTGKVDDVATPVAQTSIDAKATQLAVGAAEKNEIFEQKLADWMDDKNQVEMTAGMTPPGKQGGVEQKPEMPAMTKPFAHPAWNQELGERILWMNNKAVPFAELRLNPQHLGPVSIHIDMDQDQARIAFSTQQASVRDAIEAAVPKLREMLGTQQLNLAEVSVSQSSAFDQGKSPGFGQMAQQQQGDGGQKKGDGTGVFDHNSPLADIAEATDPIRAMVSNGLLNLFA